MAKECLISYIQKEDDFLKGNKSSNFELDEIEYCCDDLSNAHIDEYIDFGREYSGKVTHKFGALIKDEGYPMEYDNIEHNTLRISFCPFCGAKIISKRSKHLKRVLKSCKEVTKKVPEYKYEDIKENDGKFEI